MSSDPELWRFSVDEVQAALERAEACLGEELCRPLRVVVQAYAFIYHELLEKTLSIRRLQQMLFGPKTERRQRKAATGEEAPNEHDENTENAEASASTEDRDPRRKGRAQSDRKRKGHGRNSAEVYTGAQWRHVPHATFSHGDPCPCPKDGKLYALAEPAKVVQLHGQPPIGATVDRCERLRCNLCGHVFTAKPADAEDKYPPSVATTVAVLRYGYGVPMTRLASLQDSAGVPMPAANQWMVVAEGVGAVEPVYEELIWQAARGEQVYNDDTPGRILELMDDAKREEALGPDEPQRKSVQTSGILSWTDGTWIALFWTGVRNAGENLQEVLDRRPQDLPLPRQMADALPENNAPRAEVERGNCSAHARRKFVEVAESFPEKVDYVLEEIAAVYRVDDEAKEQELTDKQRLELHQAKSQPVMDRLHAWLKRQFDERLVEPNSSLGQAIKYMLNHWDGLTLFLREAGAPLDNNICEQALKMVIRHRKNSLFYQTRRGAYVGDVYMSLIHTCRLNGINPWDYLNELQRNSEAVAADPLAWMPWNYPTARDQNDSPRPPD